MNSLNSILIEGNLAKDPDLKKTAKGTFVCNFTIASSRYFMVDGEYQQEIDFFDVTVWSELAEICGEKLKKGRGVRIIGRLSQSRWKDEQGKNRSRVYITADHVEFKAEKINKK